MPHGSSPEDRVLLSGLGMGESPRWHDGRSGSRLGDGRDRRGRPRRHQRGHGARRRGQRLGRNWLPDGRMLVTGGELIRVEPDGSRVRHADLSHISPFGWSEITVDGRGNIYVDTINFDFADFNDVIASGKAPGKIALVTPDGDAREVADDLAFPNGMVVTPGQQHADRRRIVRSSAHRLRHRGRRQPVEPASLGRCHGRRDLHRCRRRRVVQRRRTGRGRGVSPRPRGR